jgi:hypothetical protein
VAPPWWVPPFTKIAATADAVIEDHNAQEMGINGHVGAAVVVPCLRIGQFIKRFLGSFFNSTYRLSQQPLARLAELIQCRHL